VVHSVEGTFTVFMMTFVSRLRPAKGELPLSWQKAQFASKIGWMSAERVGPLGQAGSATQSGSAQSI
jgi:hypothetical protein